MRADELSASCCAPGPTPPTRSPATAPTATPGSKDKRRRPPPRWPTREAARRAPGAAFRRGPPGRSCSSSRAWTRRGRAAPSSTWTAFNPLGCPRPGRSRRRREEEREHDFLWRIRRALPASARSAMFDRSHYEDVDRPGSRLVPEATSASRYARHRTGSRTELAEVRRHHREVPPRTSATRTSGSGSWPGWRTRPSGGSSTSATSTSGSSGRRTRRPTPSRARRSRPDAAPWYVVPADRKWYREWAVARILRRDPRPTMDPPSTPPGRPRRRRRSSAWPMGRIPGRQSRGVCSRRAFRYLEQDGRSDSSTMRPMTGRRYLSMLGDRLAQDVAEAGHPHGPQQPADDVEGHERAVLHGRPPRPGWGRRSARSGRTGPARSSSSRASRSTARAFSTYSCLKILESGRRNSDGPTRAPKT